MDYKKKYLKYKFKYLKIKQFGGENINDLVGYGFKISNINITDFFNNFQKEEFPYVYICFDNDKKIIPYSFIAKAEDESIINSLRDDIIYKIDNGIEEINEEDKIDYNIEGYGYDSNKIVLYNRNGNYDENADYIKNKVPKKYQILLLEGGLEKFQTEYPNIVLNCEELVKKFSEDKKKMPIFPSNIPEYGIFIGSSDSATKETIDLLNIKGIINIAGNDHRADISLIDKYKYVDIEDNHIDPNTFKKILDECFDFYQQTEKPILIHCSRGKSRSASIVIGIIMKLSNMSYDQAFEIVKKYRDIIKPNNDFETILRSLKN